MEDIKYRNSSGVWEDFILPIENGGTNSSNYYEAANNLLYPNLGGGVLIPDKSNFNDYIIPGTYVVNDNEKTSGMLNIPFSKAGKLMVEQVIDIIDTKLGYLKQTYSAYDGNEYIRTYDGYYKTWSSWQSIGLLAYPVNSIYISYSSTSPAILFGGTWVQMTGRFLRMANDVATGGSDTTTHVHNFGYFYNAYYGAYVGTDHWFKPMVYRSDGTYYPADAVVEDANATTSVNTGLNTASSVKSAKRYKGIGGTSYTSVSNMPAYQDLYVWRRTA